MSDSRPGVEAEPLTFVELDEIPVSRLKGVGPRKVEVLDGVGVRSVADLLTFYPRRYVDRTRQAAIADLAVGEEATVVAEVVRSSSAADPPRAVDGADRRHRRHGLAAAHVLQPAVAGAAAAGGPHGGRLRPPRDVPGRAQMANPVVDLIGDRTGRIVPVYPQSEKAGLSTWEIGGWVRRGPAAHPSAGHRRSGARRDPRRAGS